MLTHPICGCCSNNRRLNTGTYLGPLSPSLTTLQALWLWFCYCGVSHPRRDVLGVSAKHEKLLNASQRWCKMNHGGRWMGLWLTSEIRGQRLRSHNLVLQGLIKKIPRGMKNTDLLGLYIFLKLLQLFWSTANFGNNFLISKFELQSSLTGGIKKHGLSKNTWIYLNQQIIAKITIMYLPHFLFGNFRKTFVDIMVISLLCKGRNWT